MKRYTDQIFNVWGDGEIMQSVIAHMYSAEWVRLHCNGNNPMPWRITHRIRVYLKDKRP